MLTGGVADPGGNTTISVTPSYTNAPPGGPAAGAAINITLNYTDYESSVFVGAQQDSAVYDGTNLFITPTPAGALPMGTESGVPLVSTGNVATGSLDWARYYGANPTAIPEPGTLSAAILACAGLVSPRRRANKA